jgi:hypothetical protein
MHESFLKFSFSGQMRTKVAWKLIRHGWIFLVKREKLSLTISLKFEPLSSKSIRIDKSR